MQQKTIGIVIFDDVEVLDFCGPFEVFSVTRLDETRRREEASPFRLLLVAPKPGQVVTNGGMKVSPDYSIENCPPLDILLVPGGWGTRRELSNRELLDWIATRAGQAETVASVCTGSLLLGEAKLLQGRRATTHWATLGIMRERFPDVNVTGELHVVDEGNVVTSAGISAGIDLALMLVARFVGENIARNTARYMEYPYPESNQRRVAISE